MWWYLHNNGQSRWRPAGRSRSTVSETRAVSTEGDSSLTSFDIGYFWCLVSQYTAPAALDWVVSCEEFLLPQNSHKDYVYCSIVVNRYCWRPHCKGWRDRVLLARTAVLKPERRRPPPPWRHFLHSATKQQPLSSFHKGPFLSADKDEKQEVFNDMHWNSVKNSTAKLGSPYF